jgi:GR25 family glycosyltransferase involved in LPS biosynthesis
MKSICIYLLHWEKLSDRTKNIDKIREISKLQNIFNIEIEIIKEHNPDTFNLESIKNLIKFEIPENHPLVHFRTQLTQRTISNTLKHYAAIQKIACSDDYDYYLVLEDDVEINTSFFNQLDEIINFVKNNNEHSSFDMIFFGHPPEADTDKTKISLKPVLNNINPLITCDSYMISKSTAKQLMINFFPISFDTTVHLTQLLKNHNLNALKSFPNLTGDGSKIGTYPSSIKENNVLLFNNDYKSLYKNIETNEDCLDINESIYQQTLYKENPDMLHMMALTYLKSKKFDVSFSYFKKAFEAYERNNCSLNKNSVFFKNYLTTFKFIQ